MIENQYQQFIGKIINVTETPSISNIGGKDYTFNNQKISRNETLINEIKKIHGDNVRVWLPNTVGTMDYRLDRLNVCIEKVGDNYQITRIYLG